MHCCRSWVLLVAAKGAHGSSWLKHKYKDAQVDEDKWRHEVQQCAGAYALGVLLQIGKVNALTNSFQALIPV